MRSGKGYRLYPVPYSMSLLPAAGWTASESVSQRNSWWFQRTPASTHSRRCRRRTCRSQEPGWHATHLWTRTSSWTSAWMLRGSGGKRIGPREGVELYTIGWGAAPIGQSPWDGNVDACRIIQSHLWRPEPRAVDTSIYIDTST